MKSASADSGASVSSSAVPKFVFKRSMTSRGEKSADIDMGVLAVTPEFDGRRARAEASEFDRSFWEMEMYRRHPELADLVARMDPVARAATFAAIYMPRQRLMPQESILSLISQHLSLLGLTETVAAMEDSFALPITYPDHHPFSQLLRILERGVLNAEKFWQIVIPGPDASPSREEVKKMLAAQLKAALGILPGEPQTGNPIFHEDEKELENILMDENTRMPKGATMNQLIYAAVTQFREFHESFSDALLMTYSGYVTTLDLFDKLMEMWLMVQKLNERADAKKRQQLESRFGVFFCRWIEMAFFDFDPMLLRRINDWLARMKAGNPALHRMVKMALRTKTSGKPAADAKKKARLSCVNIPSNLFLSKFSLSSVDVGELAKQITMWTAKYYYAITPKELLGCAWMKPNTKHQSPNIVELTNKFCTLGDWVVSEILYTKSIKGKVKLLQFFSSLANELFKMGNFFDAIAVATSLNSNSIYRLQWHRKRAGEEANQIVDKIMDATKSDNNFADLHALHDNALKKGPTFPYVGVYLTQLAFTYEGNADFIDDRLINFTKCFGIYKVISKILSFQQNPYNFVEIQQIQEKLMALVRRDESELYAKSLKVEPPDLTEAAFLAQYDKESLMFARGRQGARRSSVMG